MNFEIFYLFLSYFLILFSILGYGKLFGNFVFEVNDLNIGYQGISGVFFLIIYSYISHYLFAHSLIHNSIVLILGNVLFFLQFKKFYKKKSFEVFLINFLVLFLALLLFKTHDDFSYYHFPYTYYLTQSPLLIGIGQFNHGFRTPSSLFYINSLFYLPIIKYYSFYIPTLLIMGFANLILLKNIFKHKKKVKQDYIFYFCLLSFIFLNIFFYRLQEHGTDRTAQILTIILLLQIFIFIKFQKNYREIFNYSLLTLGIIISLKAFYLLYLILSLPLLYILYLEKKINFIGYILKQIIFYLFILLIFLIVSVYYFNTGCLIYPAPLTCMNSLEWSIGSEETSRLKIHYELWSKAGKTPNFVTEDPEFYLKNFNWLTNWMDMYFFNKMSDFLLGIFFLVIMVGLFFFKKEKTEQVYKKELKYISIIYFFLLVIFLEWFLNHPSLRYGGYVIITSLFFIPASLILQKFKNNNHELIKKINSLILITLVIFTLRNYLRINDEILKYDYHPLTKPYYYVDNNHFRYEKKFDELINNYYKCKNKHNNCNKEKFQNLREFSDGRFIFIRN